MKKRMNNVISQVVYLEGQIHLSRKLESFFPQQQVEDWPGNYALKFLVDKCSTFQETKRTPRMWMLFELKRKLPQKSLLTTSSYVQCFDSCGISFYDRQNRFLSSSHQLWLQSLPFYQLKLQNFNPIHIISNQCTNRIYIL